MEHDTALWVFGYGSLMWDPGFSHVERRLATLTGYHRRFCLRSVHYRGTPDEPGLVLGLDAAPGTRCRGVAYRVADADADDVIAYLRRRELVSYAYHERRVAIEAGDPANTVTAVTFIVDRAHKQYAGHLSADAQAGIIATSHGERGSNLDYLRNTLTHLRECGIHDEELETLAAVVAARTG